MRRGSYRSSLHCPGLRPPGERDRLRRRFTVFQLTGCTRGIVMQLPSPPKVSAVEVVPAQPTEAESAKIARLSAEPNKSLPQVAYVVKVRLKTKPPVTS